MRFWLCDCCYNSGTLYKYFSFVRHQSFFFFFLLMKNKGILFPFLVYVSFADKCPLSLQSISVRCTGIQTKATFCLVCVVFFFLRRKSSAKKRCCSWPMTSCKHMLRKLNSIWSEEEGPGCSLCANKTHLGLFVLHMLCASSTANHNCLIPCPGHIPGIRAVGWAQGLPWDAAASGLSCWFVPRTKPQPWLGLSVAVALIRAVFYHHY